MSARKATTLIAGKFGSRHFGTKPYLAEALQRTGKDKPTVLYVGAASGDDKNFGTALGALGAAAVVCLLYLLLGNARVLSQGGVESLADARSVPLVLALVAVLTTLGGPVQLLMSRRIEARADVHALDLTTDPDAFIAMQRRLAITNLSDLNPPPLVYGLFASHPTAPERIALARDWEKLHEAEARVAGP